MSRLVQAANAKVLEAGMAVQSPAGIPMATTLVSCALRYDRALVAHVGDSRCYLVRRDNYRTHARPYPSRRADADGIAFSARSCRLTKSPSAQPIAG